jgi:hypothetical protein
VHASRTKTDNAENRGLALAAAFSGHVAPRNPKKPVLTCGLLLPLCAHGNAHLPASDYGPTPRRAKSDFLSVKQNFVEMAIKAAMGCPIAKNGRSPHDLGYVGLYSAPRSCRLTDMIAQIINQFAQVIKTESVK